MADIKPKIGNTPPKKGDLKKDELGVDIQNAKLYIGLRDGNPLLISGDSATWTNPEPTTAEDVDGIPPQTTIPIGLNAISVLERILYPEYGVSFTSINTGLQSNYELGINVSNPTAIINWTRSPGNDDKWIQNSLDITYFGFATGTLSTGGNPLLNTKTVNYPNTFRGTSLNSNELTIKLEADELDNGIQSSNEISSTSTWWSRIFWGKSNNTNLTDPTSLTNLLLTSKSTSEQSLQMTSPTGSGYFYVFIHNSYEITRMSLAGFDIALLSPALPNVNVTRNGLTIPYKRYRSSNILNASLNIITSYKFV